MITIMLCLVCGILMGLWMRRRPIKHIPRLIQTLVWILLFMMGLSIGSNDAIFQNLTKIGSDSLLVGLAATLGSAIAAWLFLHLIKRKNDER